MPGTQSLTINGKAVSADVDPRTLLVEFLRNDLELTGTHIGCDTGQCGACTVLMNGMAVKACTILAAQARGASITTIEGLAEPAGTMHPMQVPAYSVAIRSGDQVFVSGMHWWRSSAPRASGDADRAPP